MLLASNLMLGGILERTVSGESVPGSGGSCCLFVVDRMGSPGLATRNLGSAAQPVNHSAGVWPHQSAPGRRGGTGCSGPVQMHMPRESLTRNRWSEHDHSSVRLLFENKSKRCLFGHEL